MTSEERRSARRKRREEKRAEKRIKAIGVYDNYDRVKDANNLKRAMFSACKGVGWKASVKKYKASFLRGIRKARVSMQNGSKVTMGFIQFTVCERGKVRHIKAVHFAERVIQKSLCDYALVPVLRYNLVYDNGASLKGKGIHFALNRVKRHLREYYAEHRSNKGWILLVDFHGYFDHIQHEPIKRMILAAFADRHLRWLIWQFVKSFGTKSLGLGSQVSQILAVSYANKPDHYIKEVLRVGRSARYNDDMYIMHESRDYLKHCLEEMMPIFSALGIELNEKKTRIIKLKRFTFLKARFFMDKNGRVTVKGNRDSFKRMRSKLKFFRHQLDENKMTFKQILSGYQSWYGFQNHNDCHKALREMDKLFFSLFGIWIPHGRTRRTTKSLKRRIRFMWVYVDEKGTVLALNASNMKGNTGWIEAATTLTVNDPISHDGASLYKVKDGVVVARSKEEMEGDKTDLPGGSEEMDVEARVEALEQESISTMLAITEIYEMMLGG